MKSQIRMSSHGEVKLGTFEEVISIPDRYLNDHCLVKKDNEWHFSGITSLYWLFFKNGWWTHFVVSDSPFDFWGCEPVRLGYCHASEIISHNGDWLITHCKTEPDDYSDNSKDMFLGKLNWPQGAYPELL
jgi:hypothetical protein